MKISLTHQTAVGLLDGAWLGVSLAAVGGDADVAQVQDARQDPEKVPLNGLINLIWICKSLKYQRLVYYLRNCRAYFRFPDQSANLIELGMAKSPCPGTYRTTTL